MKKKKIFLTLLACVSVATLVSCGGKKKESETLAPQITETGENVETTGTEVSEFKVTFNNFDGTELYSYTAHAGDVATYKGDTPERLDGDYFASYIFDGWDKPLETVNQNVVYTAKYKVIYSTTYYSNGLLFELSEDQQGWYIRKYLGSDTNVVVPATFDGLPVTKILSGAFSDNKSITNIHIGENIRYIGENAFLNMEKMENITVSDKNPVYSVVDDALIGTYRKSNYTLKSLIYVPSTKKGFYEIPSDVSIYRGCLSGSQLNDLKFSTDVFKPLNIEGSFIAEAYNSQYTNYVFKDLFGGTEEDVNNAHVIHVIVSGGDIPAGMFANNKKLESISLYNNQYNPIEEIGALAFYGCSSLHSMVIPNTVEVIRKRAYENCNFETLAIGEDENLRLQVVEDYAFNCDVEETLIDNGLEYVGNDANPYVLAYSIDSNNTRMQKSATISEYTLFLRDELLADQYYSEGVENFYMSNARLRSIGAKSLFYLTGNIVLPATLNYIGDNPISNFSKYSKNGNFYYLLDDAKTTLDALENKKYYIGALGDSQLSLDSTTKFITANTFSNVTGLSSNTESTAYFKYDKIEKILYTSDYRTLLFANTDEEEININQNTKEISDYAFKGSETITLNLYDIEYISDKAFYGSNPSDTLELRYKYADGKIIENRFNNLVYFASLFTNSNITNIKVGNKLSYFEELPSKMLDKKLDLLEKDGYSVISITNKENLSYDYQDDFRYYEKIYASLGLINESIGEN